jgi:uncharacterized protein (DUF2141 family)
MIRSTLIAAALLIAPLATAHAQTAPEAPAAAPAAEASLTLSFEGVKTREGALMIALFDSPEGWASGKPARVAITFAAADTPKTTIDGLAPGTYAARALQDVDGNGKMTVNPFGLPVEPYGFTNGAKPNMGSPSFEAAAFTVAPGANAQTITLR